MGLTTLATGSAPAAAAATGCDVPTTTTVPPFAFAGRFATGTATAGETAAEIVAHEAGRLYVLDVGAVLVLDVTDPAAPTLVGRLDVPRDPTSVAVSRGLVAVSVPAAVRTDPGAVHFFLHGREVGRVAVGSLPDMLTFTPDGRLLVVANEGEPSGYGPGHVDPEGSVSVITVQPFRVGAKGNPQPVEAISLAGLAAPAGVRVTGPGASVAQDLEPEYVTVAADSRTAWVSLQENNAILRVDLRAKEVRGLYPLGSVDHGLPGNRLDASDRDGGLNLQNWRVRGLFMPDGIASLEVGGEQFVLTANEGDAREYAGHVDVSRARSVADLALNPDAASDARLGRLNVVTTAPSTRTSAGKLADLHSFGTRSFSVRAADGTLLWDSGEAFECLTAALVPGLFNASNSGPAADNRSDDKGPEPEAVVVGRVGARTLAFVALERVGGVLVYDVSDPRAPLFAQYLTTYDPATGARPDAGPEGLSFVPAEASSTGLPQLWVGHETTGTVVGFTLAQE